jgi:hypothetical protein
MVTMHKRKTRKKSKAAQIRKLYKQGSLTPAEIATKLGVAINYVYVVRGQMKQDGLVRTSPPADPTAMPVPTSSGKRRGRPPKRIEPKLESLSEPLPTYYTPPKPIKGVTYVYEAPRNEFGIIASPPVGLWNMFVAKLRRWLAK